MFPFPETVRAEPWASLPDALRRDGSSAWADANKPGEACDSFLEGPSFDRAGNLYLVDIPYGRILRVAPGGDWAVVAAYDGWPNGLKIHRDGRLFVTDYKRGIVTVDPESGTVTPVFETLRSEGFKGVNDLFFDAAGTLYFTDQGQTGLHDPTGRVYRADLATGRLERLIDTCPSPNGLVTDLAERALLVGMTRASEVWRLPLFADGVSKVGLFARTPAGLSGPDGLALDAEGSVYVCNPGHGAVFAFTRTGLPLLHVDCSAIGLTATNLAFGGADGRDLFVTVSDAGVVACARVPVAGRRMFSHAAG